MNSAAQQVKQDIATVENPFKAPDKSGAGTVGGHMMQSQAMANVQGAIVMARQFPRDSHAAMQRILDACTRTSLAEQAEYAYPKGGQTVSGPSIRLAEVCAQKWGNMDFGIIELSQEGGRSHVMAYAWDLETNVRQQKIFVVEHRRKARGEYHVLTDPREIYELTANQGARRLRACILGVIPGDVIEAAVRQCRTTLRHSMEAPEEEIRQMVEAFAEYGVSEGAIRKRLGKSFKAVTAAEVLRMRQIYASIRDNMSAPEDWFDLDAGKDNGDGPKASGKSETADEVKQRLREDDNPKVEPPAGQYDSEGCKFDPEFHASDKDGQPIKNQDGSWRKKPGKKSDEVIETARLASEDPPAADKSGELL